MKSFMAWFQASHLGRMLTRYGTRNGAVLSGGVAYAALFSVGGALVAAFSIFGLLLGNNEVLFNQVVRATADALPGLLQVDGGSGAVDPNDLIQSNLFSTTGAIAFLVALLGGLGWVDALRNGVRAMFDIPVDQRNIVVKKLLDVVWLASLGGTLLASASLSVALTSVGGMVLDLIGLDGSLGRGLIRAGGFLIVVLIDAVVLLIVYKWLAGLRLPLVVMRGALLVGGLALALLTQFSGLFIGSAGTGNPILASGAVLVTLLVLFNFISRLMLYVACWIATHDDPDAVREFGPREPVDMAKDVPDPMAIEPTVSVRAQDRTVVAAGVVLGALLALGVRVATQGVETARDVVRRT